MSAKFAVIVTIEIPAEQRERVLSLLLAHRARCLESEPATLQYDVLIPQEDQTKLLEYESFRDEAAFETHRAGPSLARWREETAHVWGSSFMWRDALLRVSSMRDAAL